MKKLIPLFWVLGISGLIILIGVGCGEKAAETADVQIASTGNPEIDALTQKLVKSANDPALRFERAQAYYKLEGYDQAIEDLKVAMAKDSTQADYFHLLADVYLDNYNSRLALKTMINAAQRFPNRIPTLLKLSEYQMILKQYDESMRTLGGILEQDPQTAEAYMMLGLNYREMGDTNRAINSFQTAVENDAQLIDGWIILGNILADTGKKVAERYFNTAVSIDPENPKTLSARGTYLLRENKLEEAKADFQAIVKKDVQNSNSFFNLGLVYMEQDSLVKAKDMFNITIQTNPIYLKAYYYRGLTYELLGDSKKAYADYQQVARHDPEYKDVSDRVERLKSTI